MPRFLSLVLSLAILLSPSVSDATEVIVGFVQGITAMDRGNALGDMGLELIEELSEIDAVWAKTKGRGVKVAVIDSGIDRSHPDLKANFAGCYNAKDKGEPCEDLNGHGTHVAGTITAALDARGVVGVAPEAKLYAVKVFDEGGITALVPIIKGLIWCGRNDMDVANMSLGAPIGTFFMRAAVKYATKVASAGNTGGRLNCPGCYPDTIAVSASNEEDLIASYSSRGRKVEFIAPGSSVYSTRPGGKYDYLSGTSMASPHVAGLAALAVASGADGVSEVRAYLKRASSSIGLERNEQGAGMIDAEKVVR